MRVEARVSEVVSRRRGGHVAHRAAAGHHTGPRTAVALAATRGDKTLADETETDVNIPVVAEMTTHR